MMDIDRIYNCDCRTGLQNIPDKSVDLVVMDPPYDLEKSGGGSFGYANRTYRSELDPLSEGITDDTLDLIVNKCKKVNIYIWCNKRQLRQYFDYFDDRGCLTDLLTWHKSNPVPACGNKYLSDTEYIVFAREKGVKLYGSYETKHKYYITSLNTTDKGLYDHPTVKPLEIVKNLIFNSTVEGGIVLDPYMGSGTTAVAARSLGRHYIGYEIDPKHYNTCLKRLDKNVKGLDMWL